jgi:hypothetical protein
VTGTGAVGYWGGHRAIAQQSRHRSLATIGAYLRVQEAWENNAGTQLGL